MVVKKLSTGRPKTLERRRATPPNDFPYRGAPAELLPPIHKLSVNAQIISRLKTYLDHEHVRVGSKLPSERQLSAMLNVSRASLREVMRALSLLGIVKAKQGYGTYLASSLRKALNHPDQILTLQESVDLVELAEARLAVEPYVASLAAIRASKQELDDIGLQLQRMRKNIKNRDQFLRHDLQFHLSLTKACGNEVLKRMMSVVLETLFGDAEEVARHYGDLPVVLTLHQEIFDALWHHDTRRARSAMVRHMRLSRKNSARLTDPVALRRRGSQERKSRPGEHFS